MVKTRSKSQAKINKLLTKRVIADIFGKNTLVLRSVTRTLDDRGQIKSITNADTTFTGDLQFGLDLDQRYISTGIVEVGDGVLYIEPDALSPLPKPGDKVVDGVSVWSILSQIESAELQGTVTHYSYRCKREINSGDTQI